VRIAKKSKKNKSQTGSQIKVVANWQHTQEASPAFKQLMMLLLKPRSNQSVETLWPEEEHQNEQ